MPGTPDDLRDRDELALGLGHLVIELVRAIYAIAAPKMTSPAPTAAENAAAKLISIADTETMLDLSRASVQRLLREGVLTSLKVRGRRLVELASITAFITRQKERPADTRASGISRHETLPISTGSIPDLSSAGAHRTRKLRAH